MGCRRFIPKKKASTTKTKSHNVSLGLSPRHQVQCSAVDEEPGKDRSEVIVRASGQQPWSAQLWPEGRSRMYDEARKREAEL